MPDYSRNSKSRRRDMVLDRAESDFHNGVRSVLFSDVSVISVSHTSIKSAIDARILCLPEGSRSPEALEDG